MFIVLQVKLIVFLGVYRIKLINLSLQKRDTKDK